MAKYRINLTVYERLELEKIINRHTTEQQIAKRAKIILLPNGECMSNKDIATELDIYSADISNVYHIEWHGVLIAHFAVHWG